MRGLVVMEESERVVGVVESEVALGFVMVELGGLWF